MNPLDGLIITVVTFFVVEFTREMWQRRRDDAFIQTLKVGALIQQRGDPRIYIVIEHTEHHLSCRYAHFARDGEIGWYMWIWSFDKDWVVREVKRIA